MPKINNHVNQTQEILNEEVGLDSSDDDCPVCCTAMNSDIDACDQCNMQIHRTCMSEIENVCMNCQMIDDQCDLESSDNVISTQHNASPKQNEPETLNQSITTSPKPAEDNPNYVMN